MEKYINEKSKCEQCAYSSKAFDEYPCNQCRNCYPDRFKPKEEKTE
jgi:hypothetical protein